VTAFQRLQRLPGAVQLTGAAALVLIGSSLAPWVTYSFGEAQGGIPNYASGIEFNAGELSVLIGGLVIFLLTRLVSQRRVLDSGAIAALGVLACGLVAVTGIRYHGDEYSIAWGFWVSAGAALALLVSGLILLGGQKDAPPPD